MWVITILVTLPHFKPHSFNTFWDFVVLPRLDLPGRDGLPLKG